MEAFIDISVATIEDAAAILDLQRCAYQSEAAIYNDFTLPPLVETLDELRAQFARKRFLKVVHQGQIIGSVRGVQTDPPDVACRVERLIVHPDHRGRGIGTALLKHIEIVHPGACRFELFTGHKSVNNIRLYERLGYGRTREERANDKVTLVFLEKRVEQPRRLVLRLERMELVAATVDTLQAEDDLPSLAQLLQAEVPSNWPTPMYDADARSHFRALMREKPESYGWTVWYILLFQDAGPRTLVGAVGAIAPPSDGGTIEVGYSILEQFFGRGYATEALRGFLNWAWQQPGLHKVIADTYPHLAASIRVLEKNGFVRCGAGAEVGAIRFELRRA